MQLENGLNRSGTNEKVEELDMKTIASIITETNFADVEDIYDALELISNENITEENFYIMRSACKSYMIEQNECLEKISLIINRDSSSEVVDAFIEITNTIDSLKLIKPTEEISKYKSAKLRI